MANTNLTHGDVKSICENLECSPSSHSPGSSLYNPGAEPHAAKHSPKHKSGAKGHMTNTEKHFGASRRAAAKNVPKHV
jgi:hypothetical protein